MKRNLVSAVLLLATFVILLGMVQFATPNLVDNDGFYHIKMAYLMRTEGLKPHFSWLPLGVLNEREFVDHHFLFHIALMPFTFGDLRLGAKWASVIFPALAFLAVWWLLRGQRVPLASLWALGLLAISEAFLYRMNMPRAQSLSLGALALGLHWLLHEKYGRAGLLAFFYVWLYNAFPLILLLAGAYGVGRWIVDGRLPWKALAFPALGVGLGLLVNPYFPDNLVFLFRHILPKISDPVGTSVGTEWFPYKTTQLMENSAPALLAFLGGTLALGVAGKRLNTATATSLFLASGFGVMLFQSRRFVEYFPPFALVFAALACAPLVADWLSGQPPLSGPGKLTEKALGWIQSRLGRSISRTLVLAAVLGAILAPLIGLTISAARQNLISSTKDYGVYAEASRWLAENTPPASRVFQTDWDDFPRLFFYNTHNTYLIGLDPTYMQLYNPEMYATWVSITQGDETAPSGLIADLFGCEYVLTDLNHGDFIRQADEDSGLELVYENGEARVYRLLRR